MSPHARSSRALSGGERLDLNWADVGAPTRATVWRHIRAFRSRPPGHADHDKRRSVFSAALEQAEQLFSAAETVGYAARPILLFYGLSQAGRAVAAASRHAGENNFRLSGHGIKVSNLKVQPTPTLRDLKIIDNGSGSFTQLAPMLQSGSLPKATTLGELWATIPDSPAPRLQVDDPEHRAALRYVHVGVAGGSVTGHIHPLPSALESATAAQLADFMASYPTLAGFTAAGGIGRKGTKAWVPDAFLAGVDPAGDEPVGLSLTWQVPTNKTNLVPLSEREQGMRTEQIVEDRLTQPYRGDSERFVFPALGGSAEPLHPLLAWWALLYALSMLARYEPESWTEQLDRDASENAVPLEALMDRALHTCPELISHAIHAVSVHGHS